MAVTNLWKFLERLQWNFGNFRTRDHKTHNWRAHFQNSFSPFLFKSAAGLSFGNVLVAVSTHIWPKVDCVSFENVLFNYSLPAADPTTCRLYFLSFSSNMLIILFVQLLFGNSVVNCRTLYPFCSYKRSIKTLSSSLKRIMYNLRHFCRYRRIIWINVNAKNTIFRSVLGSGGQSFGPKYKRNTLAPNLVD